MKIKSSLFRIAASLILLAAIVTTCACAPAPEMRLCDGGKVSFLEVEDCAGRVVEVPADPKSISCICPFAGPMLVMYGKGDVITSSCRNMVRSNLLTAMCPNIAEGSVAKNSGSVNAEEILRLEPDLIFVDEGTYAVDAERAKLDNMGIPYVVIGFEDLDSQLDAMLVIGQAVNRVDEAENYVSWCRGVYDEAEELRDSMASEGQEKESIALYHAVNEPTRTDTQGSICAEWIAYTGADNVSLGSELITEGDKAYTTVEQVYVWNPDVIICNEPGVPEYIMTDPRWAGLSCVQEGKVYQIPVGISRMGHPTSTETALALIWLEHLLYPEAYPVDFPEVLKQYYRDFYDYEIDDALAQAIIAGTDMRTVDSVKPAA